MSQTKVDITDILKRDFKDSKISVVDNTWKFNTRSINSGQLSSLAYIMHERSTKVDIKRSGLGMTVIIQA